MTETASPLLSCLPFAAAAALVAFKSVCVYLSWKHEHRVFAGDILWAVPFVICLSLVGVFCARGWVLSEVGVLEMGIYAFGTCLCGSATQLRRHLATSLAKLSPWPRRGLRAFIACSTIAFVSTCCAFVIDFIWFSDTGQIAVRFFAVTVLVFLALSCVLYFLGQRSGALVCLAPLVAFGFGVAQYFVLHFKGVPIMPTDLLALETAGAVAGGYRYLLTSRILIALFFVGVDLFALSLVMPEIAPSKHLRVANVLANVFVAGILVWVYARAFTAIDLSGLLGFEYDRWALVMNYQTTGFVPTFIEVAQDLPIEAPENYDAGETEKLVKSLAAEFDAHMETTQEREVSKTQFQEVKPAIVVVMNETFTDMSIYDEIRQVGYEGPRYYKSLSDTVQRGTLMVPVIGGGTANTEFEFLTGNSMAFIGVGKYPYQLYNLTQSDSLVKQLIEVGYDATAMHPNNPTNWKRMTAYKQLGFERFLSAEDFANDPWYHAGVTDASTYDKILEMLAQDDSPQFIFDVTMQNHGGYGAGTVPDGDVVNLNVPGVKNLDQLTELGTYLACIERADSDLAYFIERLQSLERPVVLIFFGDHQPGVAETLGYALNTQAAPLEKELKKYESTYMVWANYDIAGATSGNVRETSSSKLAAEVLYRIGAPLTNRQKADLMLAQEVSAENIIGYRGADGLRYALGAESPYSAAETQMQSIQYLMFGSKVS